jgi:hypothetical protein
MKAKFVYEAIGDILKPKDPETIMQSFGEDFNEVFKKVMLALVKRGYMLQPLKEAKKDYEKHDYSYQGKRIIAGDASWIKLRAAEELDNMDIFWNDSMYEDDPSSDSMIHIIQLEDGSYMVEVSVNFRGTWHSRGDDDKDAYFDRYIDVKNEEDVVPTTLNQVEKAEKFLQSEIEKLKEYGRNW